jgi:hypothetical protein
MRRLFTIFLALFATTAAQAADWSYEGGSVPIAWVDNGAAQFQFACRGGDLAMGYWVKKPHKTVAGAGAMSVALSPDGGGTIFAQDMPMIHADGSSVIVRGPVARQWARLAQQAKTTMDVAFVRAGGERLDENAFGAAGSSAAIRQVLDRCG